MILGQIRRDQAWRVFPSWGVALIANMLLCMGLVAGVAARHREPLSAWALLAITWGTVGLYLALGRPGRRGDLFDLALPVSARRIWLAHLAATALGGTILVAAGVAGIAFATSRAVAPWAAAAATAGSAGPGLLTFAVLLEAGTLLAAVLIQVPKPSLARVPASVVHAAWIGFVLVGELALLLALHGSGLLAAAVLLLLAVGVGAWAYRTVPEAFVVTPREPLKGPAGAPRAGEEEEEEADRVSRMSASPARGTILLSVLRCLSAGAKEMAIYPFVILFGLFLGGGLRWVFDGSSLNDLRYLYLPMATYLLASFLGPRLISLHRLDPLPVSRRLLFAGLILPSALVFAASYGVGRLVASHGDSRIEYVDFQLVGPEKTEGSSGKDQKAWRVTVPLRVYRLAREGKVPVLTSPWGESHPPEATPLLTGTAMDLYSPYDTPPGSSAKFVALQISRAARAVYGVTISPEEVERRWLTEGPDGKVAGKLDSLPIHAERPGLRAATGPLFPLVMALACVPWMLLAAALFRTYRSGVVPWARQAVYWGGLGILLAAFIALSLAAVSGWVPFFFARALVEIPAWRFGASLSGTAAAWLAGSLLLLGSYFLAEREFRLMEVPARPTRYTLMKVCQEET
jgi:hypothetical protein